MILFPVWDEDLEIEATSTLLSNGTISINVTFMVGIPRASN